MRKAALFFTLVIVLVTASIPAAAHPGRTDSKGGHTCRTNCEKWGLEYGEYHYHNGGSSKSKKSSDSGTKSTQIKATKTTKQTTKKASAPSYQKSSLALKVNGEVVALSSSPIFVQNTNLVPLRELAESLGAATSWDADTQTIRIVKGEQEITLTIGSSKIFYNGLAETLSAAPKVLNSVTYVPAQAVARGLGASLSYDKATDTLSITSE